MSTIKKIPYPGDLNAIETAVWAAEFVRRRSTISMGSDQSLESELTGCVVSANCAVEDLRRTREVSSVNAWQAICSPTHIKEEK